MLTPDQLQRMHYGAKQRMLIVSQWACPCKVSYIRRVKRLDILHDVIKRLGKAYKESLNQKHIVKLQDHIVN